MSDVLAPRRPSSALSAGSVPPIQFLGPVWGVLCAAVDGEGADGRFCVSLTRRSSLLLGVGTCLALSGSAVFVAGVPAEAEPLTTSVATTSASKAATSDRVSVLERATRAADRAAEREQARLVTIRHKQVVKDRQKRAAATKAENERKAAAAAKAKAAAAAKAKSARKAAAAKSSRSTVRAVAPSSGSTRQIGQALAAKRGWTGNQWTCLNNLWTRESGWRTTAAGYSGAYGIPQALPGSKMASAGSDWRTNPATQITWGLNYISGRYGTPCGAWSSFQSKGWY